VTGDYLALNVRSADAAAQLTRIAHVATAYRMRTVHRSSRLLIAVGDSLDVHPLGTEIGVIIGDIYRRHVPAAAYDGAPDARHELLGSIRKGQLTRDFWGSFVALGYEEDTEHFFALASPFSTINAYTFINESCVAVSSNPRLLSEIADKRFSINWRAINHQLIWDDLPLSETCLQEVTEIRSGERLSVTKDHRISIDRMWNPWEFASSGEAIAGRPDAVDRVGREIRRCVKARIPASGVLAIDLSGGLDSSVLAAVCGARDGQTLALNLYSPQTEGDERGYARVVASHVGMALEEMTPDAGRADVSRCATAHLPRPYARSFAQEIDRLGLEFATKAKASAFINGGGGDAVFCHLQSSAPAVDALRSFGAGPGFLKTAYEVARAAQCPVWDVVTKSIRKAVRDPRKRSWRTDASFMTREAASMRFTTNAPWHTVPRDVLPGKVEHVHALYTASFNTNGLSRTGLMKGLFPLLSQPLVETCLRVPTWLWVGQGRNRLVAREAVSQLLPSRVAGRVSKGGLGRLRRDIYQKNRDRIREILLDGSLQARGLISPRDVDEYLSAGFGVTSDQSGRLLRLCDFEAWIAAWT